MTNIDSIYDEWKVSLSVYEYPFYTPVFYRLKFDRKNSHYEGGTLLLQRTIDLIRERL